MSLSAGLQTELDRIATEVAEEFMGLSVGLQTEQ